MELKRKKPFYFLDPKKAAEVLEGELTYLGTWDIKEEYRPRMIFHNSKPNLKKGHKEYVTIQIANSSAYVSGFTKQEIDPYRYRTCIHCLHCDKVIYSSHRHDYEGCECIGDYRVTIDGGRDYTKIGYGEKAEYKVMTIDLLTKKIYNMTEKEILKADPLKYSLYGKADEET